MADIEYRAWRGGKHWTIAVDGRDCGDVRYLPGDLHQDSALEVTWWGDDVGAYPSWERVERVVERLAARR